MPEDRPQFVSLFFAGEVLVAEEWSRTEAVRPGIEIARDFGIQTREREIVITVAEAVSPHVIDLSPPAASEPAEPRRKAARMPILAHELKRAFGHPAAEEFGRMTPRLSRRRGGSLREFAALPFLMLALPFRRLASGLAPAFRTVRERPRRAAPVPPPRPSAEATRPERRSRAPKPKLVPVMAAPVDWGRRLAALGVTALALFVPIVLLAAFSGALDDIDFAEEKTIIALGALREAGAEAARLDTEAAEGFGLAAQAFSDTRSRLKNATFSLGAVLTGNGGKLRDGHRLLAAGEEAALAGARLAGAFETLDRASDAPTTDRVAALAEAFREALPHLDKALRELEAADPNSVPKDHRAAFAAAVADMRTVRDHADRFVSSADLFLEMLGAEGKRRYLVLFQNDRELRPTGGFIGSYALMDVVDGRIVGTEIPAGGSYDLRGGLVARVAAPEQLRLVNPRWEFQDANWFADFPTSARTLVWFYEKSGGPTVDGVIAVTTTFMEDLLSVIGPVDLASYGKTIDTENFWLETQKSVELEYDRSENRPKQIISDMAPKVLERLVDIEGSSLMPLMNVVSDALSEKRILFYFRDESEQGLAADYGWTGELAPVRNADFLSVVDTNIAGGKTDGVVSAELRLESDIRADGSIINTLTVRRTHHGKKGDLFTGIKNIDYMRVYVPHGSELVSAEGFEAPGAGYFLEADETLDASTMLAAAIGKKDVHAPSGTDVTEESGLTVFGNWIQLEPGETRSVRIVYRLPFSARELMKAPASPWESLKEMIGAFEPTVTTRLVVRRQPGAENRAFSYLLRRPDGWRVRSRVPHDAVLRSGGLAWEGRLDRDLYLGAVLSVKE